tara:strand:+ start:411 stop:731 length:321 start_codon:yes stop_codon:yes gene_type:complete
MSQLPVIRMWITNKKTRKISTSMSEALEDFLSVAKKHGCVGSTFAEDDQRIIVFTRWLSESILEEFRSSSDYRTKEGKIIEAFTDAGFEIPEDILFNSTGNILFSN